jgi:hypothetical protein
VTESAKSLLNKNQERRLQVTLYLVERGLDEITRYLRDELPSGEMYMTENDLTPDQQARMLETIDEIKKMIIEIKDAFSLEIRVNEVRGIIMGHLSSTWENLHNTRPQNLRGFGEVAPELFEALDPKLLIIIDLVSAMLGKVSRGHGD